MKVLLIKDVRSLGKAGEIKEVKDGYGRNFLVARGYAKVATDEVIKAWQEEQKAKEEKIAKEKEEFKKIAQDIESTKLTIKHKVGKNGHLFGAITSKEIANELKKYNIDIDKKSINLKKAIKTIGIYEVECKLGHGISAKLKIDVIGE